MIQIYSPSNTNFDMNGDMTLFPEICETEAELSGTWVLNISHPLDEEGRWKYIVEEAVLSVPTFMGKNQLYRINEMDKSDTEVTAKAYPVFFDSANEVFLVDKRPTNKNGQEALDDMMAGTKYSGESNITTGNTAYFVRRNLIDVLSGTTEPTFLGTWGGEPLYDNFKVIINERAGGVHGAQVRYGMNMQGINHKVDMKDVATRIFPVAYNGRMLSTNYVDSPLIGNYAKVYTKEIIFEDVKLSSDVNDTDDKEGIIICETQEELDAALIEKCNSQFSAGIDLPAVTIEVDMVALENTEEYKDFVDLVKVSLGDTVGCYNYKLDITTEARAKKIVWDCITDSVKSVVLGDYKENVLDKFGSTVSKIENILSDNGTVMAERIQGILNGIRTQIKIQSTAAQKTDVRAILFEDLDPESPLYGALAIGTQGVQIANARTQDGRDWNWSTAMTANGIVANAIITGLLSDKTGQNYWDLDKGILTANSLYSKNATITGGTIRLSSLVQNTTPIEFTDRTGRKIRIGPSGINLQDGENDVDIMQGIIQLGKKLSDDSTLVNAYITSNGSLRAVGVYNSTTTSAANVHVGSAGSFVRSASSSERYKTDITEEIKDELNPQRLYDLPVKLFKYNEGYLSKEDDKNGKDIIGFIVEDLERIYPGAVQYVDGKPEMWNANILIPAMMKLIQELNKRVKKLEE